MVGVGEKSGSALVIMEQKFTMMSLKFYVDRLGNGKANKADVSKKMGKLQDPHSGMVRVGMWVYSFSSKTKS